MLASVGKAVLLDVGGVLFLPHLDPIRQALDRVAIDFDETKVGRAHYGVHAVDEREGSEWDQDLYVRAYVTALGVAEAEISLSYGATEAKVPEIADAVVEITETGRALRAAGLKVLDTILVSHTELIANAVGLDMERYPEIRRAIGLEADSTQA